MNCRCILLQLAEQWQAAVLAVQGINTFRKIQRGAKKQSCLALLSQLALLACLSA